MCVCVCVLNRRCANAACVCVALMLLVGVFGDRHFASVKKMNEWKERERERTAASLISIVVLCVDFSLSSLSVMLCDF